MSSVSVRTQNLGQYQGDYEAIVSASLDNQDRRMVDKYVILFDVKFPIDPSMKHIFYCFSKDPFVIHIALVGSKNCWQMAAERKIYQVAANVKGVAHPLAIEVGLARIYMILELYSGGDLYEFIRNHHTSLQPWQKDWICYSVAKTLMEFHDLQIILRDLKSENILVREDSSGIIETKFTDFGLALYMPEATEAEKTKRCGTMVCFPPEIFSSLIANGGFPSAAISTDLWMLGNIFLGVYKDENCLSDKTGKAFKYGNIPPTFRDFQSMNFGPFTAEVRDLLNFDPTARPPASWVAKRMADIFLRVYPNSPVACRVASHPDLTMDQILDILKVVKTKDGERIFDMIASYLQVS